MTLALSVLSSHSRPLCFSRVPIVILSLQRLHLHPMCIAVNGTGSFHCLFFLSFSFPLIPSSHSAIRDRDGGRGRGGRGEYQRGGRPGGGLYDSQAQGGGAKSGYVKSR